jgi:hypothetical protein
MSITYKGYNLHRIGHKWTFTHLSRPTPTTIGWGDPCHDTTQSAMEHIELLEAYKDGNTAFYRERPNLAFEPSIMVPSSLSPGQAAQWLAGWEGAYMQEKARR